MSMTSSVMPTPRTSPSTVPQRLCQSLVHQVAARVLTALYAVLTHDNLMLDP